MKQLSRTSISSYRHAHILPVLLYMVLITVAGCAITRSYPLPMGSIQAPAIYTTVVSTAQGMGCEVHQLPTAVNIMEKDGWISFAMQRDAFNLQLVLNDNNLEPEQQKARLREMRAKGDDIWVKAVIAHRHAVGLTLTPPDPSATP